MNDTRLPFPDLTSKEDAMRAFYNCFRQILTGKINVLLSITLTANSATTTVADNRIGPSTVAVLTPVTSNAAAALATTFQTWPNTTSQQLVLNHANNAQTDRNFLACLIG